MITLHRISKAGRRSKKQEQHLAMKAGLSLATVVREPMQVMRLALLMWALPWYFSSCSNTLVASSSSLLGLASFRPRGIASRQKSCQEESGRVRKGQEESGRVRKGQEGS